MSEHAPLRYVTQLRSICHEAVKLGAPPLPPMPHHVLLALLDEIIERRALAEGLVDELLAEPSKPDGLNIRDRPTDHMLRAIVEHWKNLVRKLGPSYKVEAEALALVTLGEELIELRKAPRA